MPGVRPGGRVTFRWRAKSHQKRAGMRGHAAELTASPGGLSVRTTAASQRLNKRCVTALRVARACISRLREMPTCKPHDELNSRAKTKFIPSRCSHLRCCIAECSSALPAFGLTHDSCPNGAPLAQSEFYRVTPNSSALFVTFRAPAKSYSAAGRNSRPRKTTT